MLSVIVVDDKPLSIEILEGYLQKIPFAEMKSGFTNAIAALDFIDTHKPDLVLLDIQMPEITGVQLMKMAGAKTRYILVTAYPDYAIEGFDHNAVDYLLKPVSFERFYSAMQKAKNLADQAPLETTISRDFMFLKTERRIVRLDLKDILFIEAKQNYVEVNLKGKKMLALQTMKQTEEMLPATLFCRIHKSFIINLSAIESVEQHTVNIGGTSLAVGEIYRQVFYQLIAK